MPPLRSKHRKARASPAIATCCAMPLALHEGVVDRLAKSRRRRASLSVFLQNKRFSGWAGEVLRCAAYPRNSRRVGYKATSWALSSDHVIPARLREDNAIEVAGVT